MNHTNINTKTKRLNYIQTKKKTKKLKTKLRREFSKCHAQPGGALHCARKRPATARFSFKRKKGGKGGGESDW